MQTRAVVWFFLLPLVASYPPHKTDAADHQQHGHDKRPDVIAVVRDRPEDIHDKRYFDGKVGVSVKGAQGGYHGYDLPAEHRGYLPKDRHVYVGKGDVTVDQRPYGHHDDFYSTHPFGKDKAPSFEEYSLAKTPLGYSGGHFVKSEEFFPFDFDDDDHEDEDSFGGFSPYSLDDYRR